MESMHTYYGIFQIEYRIDNIFHIEVSMIGYLKGSVEIKNQAVTIDFNIEETVLFLRCVGKPLFDIDETSFQVSKSQKRRAETKVASSAVTSDK